MSRPLGYSSGGGTQFPPFGKGLVVDLFAGGGGASTGLEWALGRHVDIAINHDREAVALHQRNHPYTKHLIEDIWDVDPVEATSGHHVDVLWASPDCTHHSKARGSKPVKKEIRALAWVVCKWAGKVRPRIIMLENVEEFADWGPLITKRDSTGSIVRDKNNEPIRVPNKAKKGQTFRTWKKHLERFGYVVEHRILKACDYGAPTTRKRLLLIARCDGEPIVWPKPTHVPRDTPRAQRKGKKLYRRAADIIDWSIPCPSIFMTKEEARDYFKQTGVRINRPLVDKTMFRIARGTGRFVLENPRPFIVPVTNGSNPATHDSLEPLRTVTACKGGDFAVATASLCGPFVTPTTHAGDHRVHDIDEPMRTVTSANRGELALVAPHIGSHFGSDGGRLRAIEEPVPTVTGRATQTSVLAPILQKYHGAKSDTGTRGRLPDEPVPTIDTQNRVALVSALMAQHNGGPRPGAPAHGVDEPVSTVTTTGAQQGVVAAHMHRQFGKSTGSDPSEPPGTIMPGGSGKTGVIAAHLQRQFGTATGSDVNEPAPTVMPGAGGGKSAIVAAFMQKYYGTGGQDQDCSDPLHTLTGKARLSLVTVQINGEPWVIVDIGMRMLTPRELYRAQGFPDSYIIDAGLDGGWLTKTAQIRMAGNSVCPQWPEALLRANMPVESRQEAAA